MSEERLDFGPVPPMVYVAMLGATVAGQVGGMAIDAVAMGRRVLWFPLALSVVLEAVVGARFGASLLGRPLTSSESGRVSIYYSAGLAAVSLPLALWTGISTGMAMPAQDGLMGWLRAAGVVLALAVGVFAGGALIRQLLMLLLARTRR
ncbi:MAG: hypothetical protein M3O36_09270 [Myxococcota bacterium]|nr:hypothetical protein [Myxococcota bacterium]